MTYLWKLHKIWIFPPCSFFRSQTISSWFETTHLDLSFPFTAVNQIFSSGLCFMSTHPSISCFSSAVIGSAALRCDAGRASCLPTWKCHLNQMFPLRERASSNARDRRIFVNEHELSCPPAENLHWFHINHASKTLMWCMRKIFFSFVSLFFTSSNCNVTSSPPLTLSLMNPLIILLQTTPCVTQRLAIMRFSFLAEGKYCF